MTGVAPKRVSTSSGTPAPRSVRSIRTESEAVAVSVAPSFGTLAVTVALPPMMPLATNVPDATSSVPMPTSSMANVGPMAGRSLPSLYTAIAWKSWLGIDPSVATRSALSGSIRIELSVRGGPASTPGDASKVPLPPASGCTVH